ncbi:NAD(P)H-dependent flavin oxidoreductase [Umezawaea sp.]|uniref:NAD(P)H-dependent flavin oxidoreductase n=1 Tax=Umezawaea sp. TaxID=1955258 RepID=UPI002ED03782
MGTSFLDDLGVALPVLAAPMAGGPTTPDLVVAAASAGALGFLAGGYRTPEQLGEQIAAVRSATGAFGVNLFAPNPVRVERAAYRRYRDAVRADAERFGAAVPPEPVEDDDHWRDKVDLLLDHPVPVVSFTFGLPDAAAVAALHRAGSVLVQTVTSADEALRAVDAGVDALVVQASAAGGHSGTLTPDRIPPEKPLRELLTEVNHAAGLPKIAAGGVVDPAEVAAMITCCARAVLVGTALLLAPEAGTSAAHRAALLGADRGDTVVTRAFTGRPARAVPNLFTAAHHDHAPSGYPALHHLTRPMRAAATAAGDPEHVNLWAGTGYRQVRPRPAADTLTDLARDL